ncbi:Uncharacterized protein BP5553_00953 [Venustampulla echinocandica]|uniref:Methyltransferase type 11 domain-containing protein n=1 Tax=Venustampulla echinocandica TaxID=2656787 RepID=A0A370TZM7_9HELO|nr:Uncharacterized protein BP5553_00953 [Venustampulla echinocandica]RDL40974.1 Uncharacterized protein BP5553_00953 [Venustampulla echinocandica]
MAQNIYDDPAFFKEYIQLPRQVRGLDGAPEWPSLRSMLPELRGSKVLDLGCGFGWTCRWARAMGAATVQGIDLSQNMLSKAREFPEDPAITYLRADMDELQLSTAIFDVVFSSLSFHYLTNLSGLLAEVNRALTPGGSLVFSVEHPTQTAPRNNSNWIKDSRGGEVWPLESYLREGPRTTNWLADGVVKQHRTMSTYITMLLDAGFVLAAIDEWGASEEQIMESPRWENTRDRPPFLLMKAVKPAI